MRTDSHWFWKFFGALALMVGLCTFCAREGRKINPKYDFCLVHPSRYENTRLWFPKVRVERADENGFHISFQESLIRVHGKLPPETAPGASVGLIGLFRIDGSLDLIRIHPLRLDMNTRSIVHGVSLLAALYVIWFFMQSFRIRWDQLVLRKKETHHG